MGYSPFNPPVYLRAFAGCFGGLTAPATSRNGGDYSQYAAIADAYAQAVDTQWGPPTPTAFELLEIENVSEAYWQGRSPFPAGPATDAGSYTEIAAEIIAKVQEANAQVVAEGIDPGAVGGGGLDVTAGTSSGIVSTLGFLNSNGVSFGLSGTQLTASVAPAPLASIVLSAGTSSAHVTDIVMSNSNNVSFGLSGSTITATATFSQSTAPGGIAAGTQTATSGTVVWSNSNNVSFGLSGSVLTASASAASTQGSINLSAGTTSALASAFTFSNSNGVSFGLSGSTITGSVATALTNVNVSAGTTSSNVSAVTFANSNNVSFGFDGTNITATATVASTQGSVKLSAGTASALASAFVFSNSNGVSFGLNGSTVTASVNAGGGGSINVSAGTTSSNVSAITFSNHNNVSFGFDGSNITATATVASTSVSIFSQDADFVTNFGISHATMSLQRVTIPAFLLATQLMVLMDLEGASNSSGALTLSHAIYTLSGGTASLASSAEGDFSWSSGSATSASSLYGGVSGTRYRAVSVNYSLTPGDYLFGWVMRTHNNGSWAIFGRAGMSIVGTYAGLETAAFLNGTSIQNVAAFPNSIAVSDTGYARTGEAAMRQPGVLLLGTGA